MRLQVREVQRRRPVCSLRVRIKRSATPLVSGSRTKAKLGTIPKNVSWFWKYSDMKGLRGRGATTPPVRHRRGRIRRPGRRPGPSLKAFIAGSRSFVASESQPMAALCLTNRPDRVKTLRRVAFDGIRSWRAVAISGRRMTDRQLREGARCILEGDRREAGHP